MATVTEKKLAYLQGTKDAIKAALVEKGQAVSNTDTFRSYAEKVKAIPTGIDITLVDNVPIALDFSGGNQLVDAGEGYAVKSATIIKPDTLIPENIKAGVTIAGIDGAYEGGGGGSSADERVKYVTFVYEENGETKEYSYPVISGDTCRDPVTLGLINKPTKESTPQYTYEHNGWSLTDGGSASASALTNVTEDRTVCAAFSATLREYTITYLDDNGSELHSETRKYGDELTYVPEKEGCKFIGWSPELATVTGDAVYTASWEESVSLEATSWERIAEISASGEAENTFALGDTKTLTLTLDDGSIQSLQVEIVGFNHDVDTSGNPIGITFMTKQVFVLSPTQTMGGKKWSTTTMKTWCNSTLLGYFPEQLQKVVKAAKKKTVYQNSSTEQTTDTVWLPCAREMYDSVGSTWKGELASTYPLFVGNDRWTRARVDASGKYVTNILRSQIYQTTAYAGEGKFVPLNQGSVETYTSISYATALSHIAFGFCI